MDWNFILTALAAAGISWLVNGFILRTGRPGIVYLGPAVEEAAKTGLAYILGTSVPATHLVFGLLEGLWEGAGKKDLPAGFTAVLEHTVFGLVTYFIYHYTGFIVAAFFFAYVIHAGWNMLVLGINRDGR
ncbi:hypothetical protein DCCM_0354 [Desulfocucumis palustris]|uniref:Uncharacterized protein n=1 Tax=Desulfocucumis palustris TaxID=1898651 RepID=A0A2L2X993_9FIRM|nr:hypothetical protein [Desulfocucumis palustris]GBF32163.1 hypothetical protein DCCM_0354 [Desulfocucumis palustris]